jgi:hypothetical protein
MVLGPSSFRVDTWHYHLDFVHHEGREEHEVRV